MGTLVVLIFFAAAIGLIWWAIQQSQAGSLAFEASQSPASVVQNAIHSFSTQGWATTTQGGSTVTFTRIQTPGCAVAIFLSIFGLIPGLIYWIAAKRTLTLSVTARGLSTQPERSAVQIGWSRNGGGRGPSLRFKEIIAPGALPSVSSLPRQSTLAEQFEDFTSGALSAGQPQRGPSGRQADATGSTPADMAGVKAIDSAASCIRCRKPGLTAKEASRNPVICDDCLVALQQGSTEGAGG